MERKLKKFRDHNTNVTIELKDEHIHIANCWDDDTFILRFKQDEKLSFLNNLLFPRELSAIFHIKEQKYELIFAPIKKDHEIIQRQFTFIYEGESFNVSYKEPTKAFLRVAKAFRECDSPSDTDYRNLRPFRDYQSIGQPDTPGFVEHYFKNKTPINFFVCGNFDKIESHIDLLKHLDFYMSYFERSSPKIIFFNHQEITQSYNIPCLKIKDNKFPQCINATKIDSVIIDLIQAARVSGNMRLGYIFYFQVLEYCAYYFLNSDLKKKLNNIISNPDLIINSEKYSQYIIEEMKNSFKNNDDSNKLTQLVTEYITYQDIKNEIEANSDYFCSPVEFDGGLSLSALFKKVEDIQNPPQMDILEAIKKNVEKIRNVLVHVRESRENKVIFPTHKNNSLITPYYHLIRRMAEIIAFRYNP